MYVYVSDYSLYGEVQKVSADFSAFLPKSYIILRVIYTVSLVKISLLVADISGMKSTGESACLIFGIR